jgi:hypothetical protein
MDNEQEIAAEQAALAEKKEEEVRASIITEFGFDEVDDAERIDKLVAKEMDSHKKLSSAIGQKIKHRTDAEALRNDPRLKVTPPSQEAPQPAAEDIGKVVAQELEKRDLDSLEYSDDLKKDIQRVAQVQNISIKQAARDPYIVFKIGEWEKAQKADEAAISRTNRSSGKKNYSIDSPPDVDMNTAEGRQEWNDYLADMKKAGH